MSKKDQRGGRGTEEAGGQEEANDRRMEMGKPARIECHRNQRMRMIQKYGMLLNVLNVKERLYKIKSETAIVFNDKKDCYL